MEQIMLAADLGGTNLRLAVVDENGQILHRSRESTPISRSKRQVLDLVIRLANECLSKIGGQTNVSAFGIAAPAVIDREAGAIVIAPNLPELNGVSISSYINERTGLSVLLENDATAAAVGESWKGASAGFESSICLTLGTGVGGGIIVGGEPLRGIDGTAGEIGHICVEPFGAACGCGSHGCLEQYASASAVLRMAQELADTFPKSALAGRAGLTSLEIFQAGIDGDELSIEVFRRFGFYLGIALGGLVNVLNPEVIVIGGGASEAWELFSTPMLEEMKKRAFRKPMERVKLTRAKLGDDAGILGVARLSLRPDGAAVA
ncbi:MAG TPA: ROK family protein [Pyrinomonadaceae bacterium]|nr:ROK family protein [Pyrinomonadaceae bacterium]